MRALAAFTVAAFAGPLDAATLGWGDGVNLQPSYFNGGVVNVGWELMRQHPRIRTVRVEIEPAVPLATVKRWLSEAHAHGYQVIATYHQAPANGSDDPEQLLRAARWWQEHYAELKTAAPLVVNLMNEWGSHRQTPATFASAYNVALPLVRAVYPGPLIIDLPGWGQEVYVAREAAPLIHDSNLVFSVHLYASAWVEYGVRRWMQPADLDALAGVGRPVLIGEFGGQRDGQADWRTLIRRARQLGWTVIAWAWNGDGEGMNMVQPTWGDQPLATKWSTAAYFDRVYPELRKRHWWERDRR